MGIVVTATAGLIIWIILWSLGVSGFDAILIGLGFTLIAVAIRNVAPRLGFDKSD